MTGPFDHEQLGGVEGATEVDPYQRLVDVEDMAFRTRQAVQVLGLLLFVVGVLAVVAMCVAAWS